MDLESEYEISLTAELIISKNFKRVALQFPDELLKVSTKVVTALRNRIYSLKESDTERTENDKEIGFFVMADTTYGSCCIDEVGALHIDADCVIHYGHTCLSPTSALPAFFVLGKASITEFRCVEHLLSHALNNEKPIVVLYGLEYAHTIPHIRELVAELRSSSGTKSKLELYFADTMSPFITPNQDHKKTNGTPGVLHGCMAEENSGAAKNSRYTIGGLKWDLPEGHKIEDYSLFWIGSDNSAFANVVLTFNGSEIVRYDAAEDYLATDFSQQRRILKRRYYLVEKAKDANIVGIVVGTLGLAGYLHMIHQMQELITAAGKKAYMLVMGRPNPAKLANFPECDVFIYVACSQTTLLDSKEFMAPVITPFEAMLAFCRGSQWTGSYIMQFQDLIHSPPVKNPNQKEEPRFSFFHGGYVEDIDTKEHENVEEASKEEKALVRATEKALQGSSKRPSSLAKGTAKSGPEYFLSRSYHGLEINGDNTSAQPYVAGRSGKASGYDDEKNRQES